VWRKLDAAVSQLSDLFANCLEGSVAKDLIADGVSKQGGH
jgi:hypothetical protein